jgi:hypothetical protein
MDISKSYAPGKKKSNGKCGLTQLHELWPQEMQPVAKAFLEILSCKIAYFKICCCAFLI